MTQPDPTLPSPTQHPTGQEDVYSFMIAAGFHPMRATQETLYREFIRLYPVDSAHGVGWHEVDCDLCNWHSSGMENPLEDVAYEHVSEHVTALDRAGWSPRSALLADLDAAREELRRAEKRAELFQSQRDRALASWEGSLAERDRMRPVVEAAQAYRDRYRFVESHPFRGHAVTSQSRALLAAVDTYETQTGGTE